MVKADAHLFRNFTAALSVTDHGNRLPQPSSDWIDFAIYTKPGPDGTGHIEIIANGKPVVTVKGPIGHADSGPRQTPVFQVRSLSAGHSGEWTLYYDYFRRSPHRNDVVG